MSDQGKTVHGIKPRGPFKWWPVLLVCVAATGMSLAVPGGLSAEPSTVVLEDFQRPDADGFPEGWDGSRSKRTAKEAYSIHKDGEVAYLKGKGANQRAFTKNITWNPKTHPILKWRWRAHVIPDDTEIVAAVFASLDVDFIGIPVNTKYVWSAKKGRGTVSEGGFFRPAEIVVRSGDAPLGEWIEEEVNVYEDFKKIHEHEPADQAWGLSLQSGPGVEVDFGSITVSAP